MNNKIPLIYLIGLMVLHVLPINTSRDFNSLSNNSIKVDLIFHILIFIPLPILIQFVNQNINI